MNHIGQDRSSAHVIGCVFHHPQLGRVHLFTLSNFLPDNIISDSLLLNSYQNSFVRDEHCEDCLKGTYFSLDLLIFTNVHSAPTMYRHYPDSGQWRAEQTRSSLSLFYKSFKDAKKYNTLQMNKNE